MMAIQKMSTNEESSPALPAITRFGGQCPPYCKYRMMAIQKMSTNEVIKLLGNEQSIVNVHNHINLQFS